jgi:hypothetical protein
MNGGLKAMTKGEIRAARKAAHAAGLSLTGDLRPTSSGPIRPPARRARRNRDNSMYQWARRYDALNGAPESDYDR